MRPKITFIVLVVMLLALGAGVALRRGGSEAAAPPAPSASASASATATASAVTSAPQPPSKPKGLGRALRVAGLGWELVAPALVANDGAAPGKESRFKKAGLTVELSAHADVTQVENALARGGDDEKGADVAVLPLQRFVASYERLKALNPVIFFVVGWSDGGEIVLSKKASFADLPAQGDVSLRATAGEPAAFLGLFAFDLLGVSPERVKLTKDDADWSALTRREAKQRSEQTSGNLLLSTAEASQLVPFVAVAQASLLQKHGAVLVELAKGWLAGHELLAQNPTAASRKIGAVKGAPEPLSVLARLGEMRAASLAENAELAGLAGRGAVTLDALFHRSWQIWRSAKVLSIPPEHAPIDGTIVASLVRAGGALKAAPSPPRTREAPRTGGKPLVSYHAPKGKLDEAALLDSIGLVSGVFPRSPIRVTVHPLGAPDKSKSEKLVLAAVERFGIAEGRIASGAARAKLASPATIEIMPVP